MVVAQLLSWVALVALGVLAVWTYRAAANAASLGLPARRSPGLATAAWVIPVVSLWWPYQTVCDVLPPGHPTRRLVLRWWVLYLLMSVGLLLVAPAPVGPPFVVVAACLLAAGIAASVAVLFRRIVADVLAAHEAARNPPGGPYV